MLRAIVLGAAVAALCPIASAAAAPGDLDTSWDGDGILPTAGRIANGAEMVVQADQKVVNARLVGGAVGVSPNLLVTRWLGADGAPDTSWSGDGAVTLTPPSGLSLISPQDIMQMASGEIVVLIDASRGGVTRHVMVKLTTAGVPDPEFGSGGFAEDELGGGGVEPRALIEHPDGGLLAAGAVGESTFEAALARFTATGTLDQTWGTGGIAVLPGLETVQDIVPHLGGFVATAWNGDQSEVVRVRADGGLDLGFGEGDGRVVVSEFGDLRVVVRPGGGLVAAGAIPVVGVEGVELVGLTAAGVLDSAFAAGGTRRHPVSDMTPHRAAIDSAGRVVVAGRHRVGAGPITLAVTRYTAAGAVDTDFAPGGAAIFGAATTFGQSVAIQSGDRIVVSGSGSGGSNGHAGAIMRLVGGDGSAPPPPPPPPGGDPPAGEPQPDGAGDLAPQGGGGFVPLGAPRAPTPGNLTDLVPEAGVSVVIQEVRQGVTVAVPAGGRAAGTRPASGPTSARATQKGLKFVPLAQVREIPVGSFVDTTKGEVKLTTASAATLGPTQTTNAFGGLFQVLQQRGAAPVTELALKGTAPGPCRTRARSAQRRRIRRLWADGRGRFRTRGAYSSATVRGTRWLTEDRCDGTLTRVTRGTVVVRDLRRKKNITVRAGKSYLARRGRS